MKQFIIFDISMPLMSDYPIINGNSNADAIKKYCKEKYPNYKVKASGANNVHLSAQQCVIENGKPLRLGYKRQTWFELINAQQ